MSLICGVGAGVGFSSVNGIGGGGGGGGDIPAIPTDQLAAHYLADQGITLTGSGITATVNEWANQISSNHNLTQSEGTAFEPTYVPVSTVFGGRPMLYGNNDALNPATVADDFTLSTPGVFTYAFVFKSDLQERYLWDSRGQGTGQSRQAGYYEHGIERTTAGGWLGVGPQWNQAGYNGMQFGIRPYASGSNSNLAPQSINTTTRPNLFSSGLEIWIYVSNGGYTFWSCNGRILGNSAFKSYTTTEQMFNMMAGLTGNPTYDWPKADKLSPSIFSGYYGPTRGYGQGAMAEFFVYDKALTMIEHNNLLDNLTHKYKINYIKPTTLEEGNTLDADFGGFVRSPASQVVVNAPNDIYLNGNNYNQYFGMDVKKGIDFTRPGKYEFKFGENPASSTNPIFYPGFTFMSPLNAMLQNVYWTSSNFPDLSTLRPSAATYWAYNTDQGQAPGIYIRKNADTTYSYVLGAGFSPVYYRSLKDWTVFTEPGATPPFTVRIEWPGAATWQGMKWYIDDVLIFDADETNFQTMPDAANSTGRNLKMTWLPSPAFPYVYGRIGRVYDMKLLEGSYINAPWNYDDFTIISEGLVGHWDAGYGVGLSGSNVTSWEDKVGGHTLTNTAGNQPTFVASGSLNSQPSIDFDRASGQSLFTTDTSFLPNAVDGGFTTLVVCKGTYSSGSQNWIMTGWCDGTYTQGFWLFKNGGTEQTQTICQTPAASGTITSGYVNLPGSGWQITGAQGCIASTMGHTGEAKRYYVRSNNREIIDTNGQTSYTATSYPGLYIGGYPDGSDGFDGEIMEVLVYNRLLSLSELQETEKKLMFKYNLFG